MGANALAGLIALKSQGTDSQINTASVGMESYGGRRLGIRTGGSLSANLRGRIAIQHYESDGYVDNHWLNRSDTNARDEITARGALTWEGGNHLSRLPFITPTSIMVTTPSLWITPAGPFLTSLARMT
ncbi:MAG: hypothetical protein CM15mP74_01940 [Halieaceae bacterium]|nr:MAG: hypothetical protein CM15mP74_01940 [Halieaceae bacterium]